MSQLSIALDYDNTYTAEPALWDGFILIAQQFEIDIRIVTIRDDRFDRTEQIAALEQMLPVIYTRGVAKKWFCEHFTGGFNPSIWIDDKPESILNNSTATPEALAQWRSSRDEETV